MKIDLEQSDLDAIAGRVLEILRPTLKGNGAAPDEVFDVDGLAGYLKVKPSWVHQNHKAEGIPSFRLGNQLRFRRSQVDRWISGRTS